MNPGTNQIDGGYNTGYSSGQTNQTMMSGFIPSEFDYGGQTMPTGWEDVNWSVLDSIIGQGSSIPEEENVKIDEGELSAQEQEHLLVCLSRPPEAQSGIKMRMILISLEMHS